MSETAVNGAESASYGPCETGCGRLVHASSAARRHRKYCSDRCRLLAWAKHQPELTPKPQQARIEWTPTESKNETKKSKRRDAILARLRQGPATTLEMNILGGSGFSARIRELRVELRKRGGNIPPPEMNEDGGVYRLVE